MMSVLRVDGRVMSILEIQINYYPQYLFYYNSHLSSPRVEKTEASLKSHVPFSMKVFVSVKLGTFPLYWLNTKHNCVVLPYLLSICVH